MGAAWHRFPHHWLTCLQEGVFLLATSVARSNPNLPVHGGRRGTEHDTRTCWHQGEKNQKAIINNRIHYCLQCHSPLAQCVWDKWKRKWMPDIFLSHCIVESVCCSLTVAYYHCKGSLPVIFTSTYLCFNKSVLSLLLCWCIAGSSYGAGHHWES